jgi:hypothetical protein
MTFVRKNHIIDTVAALSRLNHMRLQALRLLSFKTSVRACARSFKGGGDINEFAMCSTSGAGKKVIE